MLTLLQYEMKKTAFMKILCGFALFISQAFVMLGTATDNYVVAGLGAGLLVFFSFLVIFILGLSSMASLSKDLNTTQGYMLFMLPKHSAYFLLAKIVESLVSTFLAGLVIVLIFFFNISYFAIDFTVKLTRNALFPSFHFTKNIFRSSIAWIFYNFSFF